VLGLGCAAAAGCIGRIGDDAPGGALPSPGPGLAAECSSAAPDTEPVMVRMLNRREYQNTIRDLLAVPTDIVADFPPDPIVAFDNQAESLVASSLLVEKHLDAAETFAAAADLGSLGLCAAPESCIDDFIAAFGRRAFRRPLTDPEKEALRGIFDEAQAAGRAVDASVRLVIEGFLMSPEFLYRAEATVSPKGGVTDVEPYELASRLSYFLWGSMPDDELLDAAGAGALATADEVEAQARRMLADPKARDVTKAFHELWLQLYKLPSTKKDTDLYPGYDVLQPLFAEETSRFAEHVFWDAEGGAREYLVSDTAFMNADLAAHYGVKGPAGAAFEPVSVARSDRFGLLTQGSVLSMFSNPDRTSPTRRGKFVRSQLLCQPPPPPPANVPPLATGASNEGTLRERLAEHMQNPACKGCHQMLDPVGFGLENYDTVGAFRAEEAGAPVDASGELLDVENGGGPFVGARELAEDLTATDEFYGCVATQWFRFAVGRPQGKRDVCTVYDIQTEFRKGGDRLPDLLVAIAKSEAFLLKNTEKAQ